MTRNATPDDRQLTLAPLDEKVDHVRGAPAAHLIIEYGDYECPYSRQAFHAIEVAERNADGLATAEELTAARNAITPPTARGIGREAARSAADVSAWEGAKRTPENAARLYGIEVTAWQRQVPAWCSSIMLPAGSCIIICCDCGPTMPSATR